MLAGAGSIMFESCAAVAVSIDVAIELQTVGGMLHTAELCSGSSSPGETFEKA